MDDYIKRENASNEIHRFRGYIDEDMEYRMKLAINKIPSADVRPVVRAHLISPNPYGTCSNCNWLIDIRDGFSFCPNCGAEMEVES